MDWLQITQALANFSAAAVLAGLLIGGVLMTAKSVEAILKERDKADEIRDARLQDQRDINTTLIGQLEKNTDAFKRIADALEARNRAEAELRSQEPVNRRSV
jgi:hypothetical protein